MEKVYTFAGYPVTLRKIDGEIYVHCKNVIGTYSQMKDFLLKKNKITNKYIFGVRQSDKCEIERSMTNPQLIKIACLEGTQSEVDEIAFKCESLLIE